MAFGRLSNAIPVLAEDRSRPTCGVERECLGHDVTEVIDFITTKASKEVE